MSDPSDAEILLPMPASAIADAVAAADETGAAAVGLVLRDGTSLAGIVPVDAEVLPSGSESAARSVPASETSRVPLAIAPHGHLTLRSVRLNYYDDILVPVDEIAGVYPISVDQAIVRRAEIDPRDWARSAVDLLAETSAERARSRGLRVERTAWAQWRLSHEGPIRWGPVEFRDDAPLYCDWTFLTQRAGGVRSIGAGFIVSASAGWSNSLWSAFQKLVVSDLRSLSIVCQYKEVGVAGYVRFLHAGDEDPDQLSIGMDGTQWDPAVITARRPSEKGIVGAGSWVLAYFRRDALMVPHDLWSRTTQATHVWGDVYPSKIMTEFGAVSCFLKARAGAYLAHAAS